MHRAVKVRLYPNKQQKELVEKHFGAARWVYNWALETRSKLYESEKKTINKFDLCKQLVQKKQEKEFEWLYETSAGMQQISIYHLDEAYTRFFREKKCFPRFKSKKLSRQSYTLSSQKFVIDEDAGKIRLEKILWVSMRGFRRIDGRQISLTVSRDNTNKYWASIIFDDGRPTPEKPEIQIDQTIGVDLGLKSFLTTSDSLKVENPRHIKKQERRLKRLQHRLSKKKKDSMNRAKARVRLAIEHQRLVSRRNDFLHKLSTQLIRENQAICVETLSVQDMMQTGHRSMHRAIGDAAWSRFIDMLSYKADWNGKWLLKIGRFEPSSKMCSACGQINRELTLADREWICDCGAKHDRDINAAKNIKRMALQSQNLIGIVPLSQREFKPVETGQKAGRRSRNQSQD